MLDTAHPSLVLIFKTACGGALAAYLLFTDKIKKIKIKIKITSFINLTSFLREDLSRLSSIFTEL